MDPWSLTWGVVVGVVMVVICCMDVYMRVVLSPSCILTPLDVDKTDRKVVDFFSPSLGLYLRAL